MARNRFFRRFQSRRLTAATEEGGDRRPERGDRTPRDQENESDAEWDEEERGRERAVKEFGRAEGLSHECRADPRECGPEGRGARYRIHRPSVDAHQDRHQYPADEKRDRGAENALGMGEETVSVAEFAGSDENRDQQKVADSETERGPRAVDACSGGISDTAHTSPSGRERYVRLVSPGENTTPSAPNPA